MPEPQNQTQSTPNSAINQKFPARTIAECDALFTTEGQPLEIGTDVVRGVTMKVWKNLPPSLREIWQITKLWGDDIYVVYADPTRGEDIRITYSQMDRLVTSLANALSTDFQCRKGDRVAIAMRNYPEWIVAFWAAASIGCIVVPINAWLTGPEMEYCITDSGSKVLILDGERVKRLLPHFDNCRKNGLTTVLVARESKVYPGVQTMDSAISRHSNKTTIPAVDIHPDDDATIFYTSGTTGKPKGALGTHRNYVTNLFNLMSTTIRAALRRGEPIPAPATDRKHVLLSVPLFHATGCHSTLQSVTATGAKLVLMHHWDAGEALRLIEKEKITNAGGVPSMIWQILEHPDLSRRDVSSITAFGYGGAPAASELVSKIKKYFPTNAPANGYGLTETSSLAVSISEEDYVLHPDAVGFACPVNELKIVDSNEKELKRGEIGEVWIKGPNVVKGYWNKPEATEKSFTKDGWLKTGDVGILNEEGMLFIRDRAKDMLIRGGENIYCVEVEDALYKHKAIMDAAVVGLPHKVLGEEVAAVVQVTREYKGRITEKDLQAHCRSLIANFKVPVLIEIFDEPLPRNANGKILKPPLRELVKNAQARRVKAKL